MAGRSQEAIANFPPLHGALYLSITSANEMDECCEFGGTLRDASSSSRSMSSLLDCEAVLYGTLGLPFTPVSSGPFAAV